MIRTNFVIYPKIKPNYEPFMYGNLYLSLMYSIVNNNFHIVLRPVISGSIFTTYSY